MLLTLPASRIVAVPVAPLKDLRKLLPLLEPNQEVGLGPLLGPYLGLSIARPLPRRPTVAPSCGDRREKLGVALKQVHYPARN